MKSPFEIKMNKQVYSSEEIIKEVKATMEFAGMELSDKETRMLQAYQDGTISGDALRLLIVELTPIREVRRWGKYYN